MAQKSSQESLSGLRTLLSNYHAFITYRPLRTEADGTVFIPDAAHVYEIPPRASISPAEEAQRARDFAKTRDTAILLPGRRFDASGTRLGQGGGWYDRFLAEVPREWLRIGFCYSDQFSETPLPRQPWDQAVDYVVVLDRSTGEGAVYSSEGTLV